MPGAQFSRFALHAALLAATGACATALAAPPVDVGAAARGNSSVDRALESRARVLDRARASGRAATDAAVGASTTERGPNTAAHGSATGSTQATPERGPGAAATFGLDKAATKRNDHASPQLGTGRVARELRGTVDAAGRAGKDAAGRTSGRILDAPGRTGLRLGWLKRGETNATAGNSATVSTSADGSVTVGHGRGHEPERILNRAEAHLARRLAQIDRMRDRAIETSDEALLQQADKLEVLARAQYSQRTTGEHAVGAAMKTYNEEQRDSRDGEAAPAEEGTETAGSEPAAPPTVTAGAKVEATANTGGTVVQTGAAVETAPEPTPAVE